MEGQKFVITITNQSFSMGRLIAMRMSQLLGVPCYNSFISEEAARILGLPQELVSENEERSRPPVADSWLSTMQFGQAGGIQDRIFSCQKDIIRSLAEKESCIIVGRCADFILDDVPNAMHIFIYGSFNERARRCAEIGLDGAMRLIARNDEARRAYHMNYAGYPPEDKTRKHILIDSGLLGLEETAKFLSEVAKKRFSL